VLQEEREQNMEVDSDCDASRSDRGRSHLMQSETDASGEYVAWVEYMQHRMNQKAETDSTLVAQQHSSSTNPSHLGQKRNIHQTHHHYNYHNSVIINNNNSVKSIPKRRKTAHFDRNNTRFYNSTQSCLSIENWST